MTVKLTAELVNFVRPTDHSKFSPSSAKRFILCPYSIKAQEQIPEPPSSKAASEGTMAHQICEDYFDHKFNGAEKTADLMMATEEMMDGAEMYYECVTGWLKHTDYIGDVLWFGLEKGLPVFPELGCFGTGDFIVVGTKGCATVDYKFGRSPVPATSKQLQTYLLSPYRYLQDIPEDYQFHSVIVQPRTDTIPKTCQYTVAEMKQFEAVLYTAILQADRNDLTPVEGDCHFCKARNPINPAFKCPAIADKANKIAGENFDGFLKDMGSAPSQELVKTQAPSSEKRDKALIKIMSLLPMMQQIAEEGEQEFLYRMQENNETIDGCTLVKVPGKAKWRLDNPEEMGKEIMKSHPGIVPCVMTEPVVKMKTQGEIKKLVGKENFDQSLVVRPVKDKVEITSEKKKQVLQGLSNYAEMIGLNTDSK